MLEARLSIRKNKGFGSVWKTTSLIFPKLTPACVTHNGEALEHEARFLGEILAVHCNYKCESVSACVVVCPQLFVRLLVILNSVRGKPAVCV